jgi:hypothetical protein
MPINRDATIARNRKANVGRIKRGGLASGFYGEALITAHTARLAEHLKKVLGKRATSRKREVESLTPEIQDALQGIRKATIAVAMLRGCLNCHHIIGQKAPPRVYKAIGSELETQARGVAVRRAMVQLLGKEEGGKEFSRLGRLFDRNASMRKKLQAEYAVLRAHGIAVAPWSQDLLARVGNFACDMLESALKGVITTDDYDIPRFSTEAAAAVKVDLMAHPIYEPSVEPPHPWICFDGIDGDTFVANCRDVPAVRAAIAQGIPHVDAVNYLQSISFRANGHVLDVVKRRELLKKVKPGDKGAQTLLAQHIEIVERFNVRPYRPFYVPLRVDFRGRLIVGPSFNFTGPDHVRGLFQFAQTAPITKEGIYWLKIACATSYDADTYMRVSKLHADTYMRVSKLPFAEREKWTNDNIELICKAGRRPLDHLEWLAGADEPIQCVALFHELANALDVGDGYHCSVPIGFDASCSGLQHFALISRDLKTACLTNLVPTIGEDLRGKAFEAPQDIYDFVLQSVWRQMVTRAEEDPVARWWIHKGRLGRKIVKKLVMTYGYSAEEWGQTSQIYQELRKRGEDIPKGAPQALMKVVRKAIETHIPAALASMNKLQALVNEHTPVWWVSPSGLPVSNSYQPSDTQTIRLYRDGKHRCRISVGWKSGQRVNKCESAIAPNFVHSMDAAHLALVANECAHEGIPLVTVHDSFNTLPCHAPRLRTILMEQLRSMYANYKFHGALAALPTGDLDLDEVTGAYAFS